MGVDYWAPGNFGIGYLVPRYFGAVLGIGYFVPGVGYWVLGVRYWVFGIMCSILGI